MPHHTLTNANGHALSAPVRNRYFYGKLLDVHHLQLEQRYFIEKLRLLNRVALGWGVLCGLEVEVRDGKLVVRPGIAIDGCGREIVVTDWFEVDDPWALTDECGRPTGERDEDGPVVLCLAYHECDIEPAPVLVADCDVREECVPGAVRERFRLLVRREAEHRVGLTPEQCRAIFWPPEEDEREDEDAPALPARPWERFAGPARESIALPPELATVVEERPDAPATTLRERVCAALLGPCVAPEDDCVPLATLVRRDDTIIVEECRTRTAVYSNATLLDLILCLAERVEECCGNGRPPTALPPVIRALFPKPGQLITADALRTPLDGKMAVALAFDRKMTRAQLETSTDAWLRVWAVTPPEGNRSRIYKAKLTFVEERPGDLAGADGFTDYFSADFSTAVARREALRPGARWVVVVRAETAAPAIVDEQHSLVLDADYTATRLTPETVTQKLWPLGDDVIDVYGSLQLPTGAAQPPPFPSGDAAHTPGGLLHSWFEIAPPEA
jgi:hypothetical protein